MADFTAEQRREMARTKIALPDGSFPIPDATHVDKAVKAVGLGSNNSDKVIRQHIIRRARALGVMQMVPDSWSSDGAVTYSKAEPVDIRCALWKDESQHLVYGVVLTPGVEDSQGDICSADEIEKAAHAWLTEFRKHDVQHSGQATDIVPVESYIAPADFDIGDQTVLKGSWVLGARVNDTEAWSRVEKGELTGWSIEGLGIREAVAA